MTKVNEAVERCVNRIAIAQQNLAALRMLQSRMSRNGKESEAVRHAVSVMHGQLYGDLAEAWEQLSWFAPINKTALEKLAERTRTWFERDDTQIMHWLGYEGSYHVDDKETFRREVLAMFGVEVSE